MLALSSTVLFSGYTMGPAATHLSTRHSDLFMSADVPLKVGVLAIQGGFAEHMQALERHSNVEAVEVRTPFELGGVDALILPGGESTAIGMGLVDTNMLDDVKEFVKTKPAWGVCAGMILLANELDEGAQQPLIGGLDINVKRNAFGRQSKSALRSMETSGAAAEAGGEAYFIRAPAVTRVGDDVEILASVPGDGVAELPEEGAVVAVKQGNLMATCFHPEISSDDSWLRVFLNDICKAEAEPIAPAPEVAVAAPWAGVDAAKDGKLGYGSTAVKRAFAVFQKGGVIMDVVDGEQARIAEEAGAVAVMALERIPADIKADGGVARSSDPSMITDVMNSCSVPVMAKSRIGHFYEAKILQALDVDCIDESEVLTAADEMHHIDKRSFDIPFVCGAQDLGEALRRIAEGAAMIRLKGNAGTGNVIQAVRHARAVFSEIRAVQAMRDDEIFYYAKELRVPVELVQQVKAAGRLPVVTFAAGGLATPADVALLMELGCDGVFVGSGIFKGENPAARARAMVAACTHYKDPATVARVSANLGKAMVGLLEHESGPEVAARLALQGRIGVDPSVAA
jgi:pyridoxal 5'-phosphate synthase pdxS subunit